VNWAQQIPLERLLLIAVAAGIAWSELRACRASLKDQGQRLGALGDRITKLEGRGGDGR
jgi:hypothetical protein